MCVCVCVCECVYMCGCEWLVSLSTVVLPNEMRVGSDIADCDQTSPLALCPPRRTLQKLTKRAPPVLQGQIVSNPVEPKRLRLGVWRECSGGQFSPVLVAVAVATCTRPTAMVTMALAQGQDRSHAKCHSMRRCQCALKFRARPAHPSPAPVAARPLVILRIGPAGMLGRREPSIRTVPLGTVPLGYQYPKS